MNSLKKKGILAFVTLLIVSVLFAFGNGGEKKKSGGKQEEGSLEERSYSVNNGRPDTLKDHNEIAAYKELEEITGVKAKFDHPASGEADQQFNLMMASGKLPDVIERIWPSVPGG